MGWPPRKKAVGVMEFAVDRVPRTEAAAFMTKKAKQKWFVHPAVPDGSEHVLVNSSKTTYPKKDKKVPVADEAPRQED